MNSKKSKIPLLVIVGPTASGKSALAVELARRFDGEVISADSRQVYKGLDIGTGKISKKEMKGVPHHLLDVADPRSAADSKSYSQTSGRYTVDVWKNQAEKAIADIHMRGKLPIIAGGTGFYIEALVDGIVFPDVPPNKKRRAELAQKTTPALFTLLKKLDSKRAVAMLRAKSGDHANRPRLIRAIEIAEALGKVPAVKKMSAKSSPYLPLFIGIDMPLALLKEKIRTRVEKRLHQGMIAEGKRLYPKISSKRMHELGMEYRALALFIEGKINRAQLAEKIATENWQYAKRQIGWLRRDDRLHKNRINWISVSSTEEFAASNILSPSISLVKNFLSNISHNPSRSRDLS